AGNEGEASMIRPSKTIPHVLAAVLIASASLAGTAAIAPVSAQGMDDAEATPEGQDGSAPQDPFGSDDAFVDCTPGAFGEGGTYEATDAEDTRVTAVIIEFQCGDTLSDGTFIPTGYRVLVEGDCDGVDCGYPVVIAKPMAQPDMYGANFAFEGRNVALRMRPPANGEGVNLFWTAREPGPDSEAERGRYRLR
ncbi:MAG: hypothetical protein AAGF49_06715, partial [Pseudomonadota bacterium]